MGSPYIGHREGGIASVQTLSTITGAPVASNTTETSGAAGVSSSGMEKTN
jgi:hypothetical protein